MAEKETILEASGLTKEFKGFVAVKNVNLRVRRHTIHALIGPNGAGKTTCFNLLTHFLTPTAGRIHFKGRDITGSSPAKIARRIRCPVVPATSEMTLPSWIFICTSAFCMCWMCRACIRSSMPRWRFNERSTQI